jgi:hypothetical protein
MSVDVRSMAFSPTMEEVIGQGLVAAGKSMKYLQVTYVTIGAIVIAFGFILPAVDPRLDSTFIPLLAFGSFMVLVGGSSNQVMRLVQKPFLTGPDNTNHFASRRIMADEAKLRIEWDNGIVNEFPWQTLPKVRVLQSTLYVAVTKQQFIVIPERAFPNDEGWNSFVSLCASRIADNNLRPLLR